MSKDTDVEVIPNVFQSQEDYEANMKFDEERDEDLLDEVNVNS